MIAMYDKLTECPLFRGMSAEQISSALSCDGDNYILTDYAASDVIARRDTAYSGLMIIVEGRASGVITYSDGSISKVDSIESPGLIAPAFLFGGYNRLPVDVVADVSTKVMTLHRGFIFELMQENIIILSNFIDIISNRANIWSKKIYFLSFKSLKQKAASYLLDHSSSDKNIVPMPDIAQIADVFASTRSALMTVLEGLERKGVIKINGNDIAILNRDAMHDILK